MWWDFLVNRNLNLVIWIWMFIVVTAVNSQQNTYIAVVSGGQPVWHNMIVITGNNNFWKNNRFEINRESSSAPHFAISNECRTNWFIAANIFLSLLSFYSCTWQLEEIVVDVAVERIDGCAVDHRGRQREKWCWRWREVTKMNYAISDNDNWFN